MDFENRKRPQDDLPYERRMYYIIKDYRRLQGRLEELKDYAKQLEKDLRKEKDKRYHLSSTNMRLSQKSVKANRGKKRLYNYITYLIEKYDIPSQEKPLFDSSEDEHPIE